MIINEESKEVTTLMEHIEGFISAEEPAPLSTTIIKYSPCETLRLINVRNGEEMPAGSSLQTNRNGDTPPETATVSTPSVDVDVDGGRTT
jgi:hypothetical protein